MRVQAVFQFYLPFVLPRSDDWSDKNLQLTFQAEDAIALVTPAPAHGPLYPDEAGITLSKQVVERDLGGPSRVLRRGAGDMLLDRIEVEIRKTVEASDLERDEVRSTFFVLAIRACNAFLVQARVAARSPDPMRLETNFDAEAGGTILLTPQTNTWWDGDTGEPIPIHGKSSDGPLAASGTWYFRRVTRGSAPFHAIGSAVVELGEFADVVDALLLDAEAAAMTYRISEALISMGTACEIASERYIDRAGRSDDQQVEALLRERVPFAVRRLNLVPDYIHGRRFESDSPEAFGLVVRMYKARNNVVHEGTAYEKLSEGTFAVTPAVALEFLGASQAAVAWLKALNNSR